MGDSNVVLLIDCDDSLALIIGQVVSEAQHLRLERVSGTDGALRRLEGGDVGLALAFCGGNIAERDVRKLLKAAGEHLAATVILIDDTDPQSPLCQSTSEDETSKRRIRFLNWGAVDCLPQPLDVRRLAFLIDLLMVRPRCQSSENDGITGRNKSWKNRGVEVPSKTEAGSTAKHDFLVASPAMSTLVDQVRRVAPLDTTVLLVGETGCGKTHAARIIHQYSTRSNKPFVVVECGALTPSLLASELFGHVRGSFTGAERDYAGKLASAEDGTVFLDEVDTIPLECQAKLLRTVEDRLFQAVGSSRTQPLRARLVVATNRPLEEEVSAGRFRSDLFYRLNVVAFSMPPLRDRQADIQPLAERFLAIFAQRAERPIRGFTGAALEAMWCYEWPGNIRELRNTVERCVALNCGPMIDRADLPEPIQRAYEQSVDSRDLIPASDRFAAANELAAARTGGELQRLLVALGRHNHNRTNTAAELGISRVTLYKKLRQHRLT